MKRTESRSIEFIIIRKTQNIKHLEFIGKAAFKSSLCFASILQNARE